MGLTRRARLTALAMFLGSSLALLHCDDDTAATPAPAATGGSSARGVTAGSGGTSTSGAGGSVVGTDGPPGVDANGNPNKHEVGDKVRGQDVFRFETFGNEGFWTDAMRLPEGVLAANFTPVKALKAGLMVDIAMVPDSLKGPAAAELETDLSPEKAPNLNDVKTTLALLNANAIMGIVVKDTNKDGKLDIGTGDKVGLTCALCHSIADGSVFSLPGGGAIGARVDGPAAHTLDVGGAIALGANSRAYFPLLQLKGPDGSTIGRGAHPGLTKDSSEEDVDAYLTDKALYPVGMFDDTFDGVGNSMHNTPFFRTDLAAPWGTAGEFKLLDQFSNTVYTALLDPTNLLQPGGRAFVKKAAGPAGEAMLADYEDVLAATKVTGYPFVKDVTMGPPGELDSLIGLKVDHTKLLDMNAYLDSLQAPKGVRDGGEAAIAEGREIFRTTGTCTSCHNVDQSKIVPPLILDMVKVWPGDDPKVLFVREPPAGPVSNTPGNTFDDKEIVINATLRGLNRGIALPLLLDLARKPVFLHDNSVPSLDNLLDTSRGPTAPHPFYVASAADRAKVVAFLRSLDTGK